MKKTLFITIPSILGIFTIILGIAVPAIRGDFWEVNKTLDGIMNDIHDEYLKR